MKKIILITPAHRLTNLKIIKKSINFNFIFKWIIVYDGTKIANNFKLFNLNKIIEFVHLSKKNEVSGNAQRNFALDFICENYSSEKYFIYFLDDDNIIHPNLYKLIKNIDYNKFYTFDQQRSRFILLGNKLSVYNIDAAMFLSDIHLVKNFRFIADKYEADGLYIENCYKKNVDNHVYIPEVACYYNYLRHNLLKRNFKKFIRFFCGSKKKSLTIG